MNTCYRFQLICFLVLGLLTQPCQGKYLILRSGFGQLRGMDITGLKDTSEGYEGRDERTHITRPDDPEKGTQGSFSYKHYNTLSVALGDDFDVFTSDVLRLELECLGVYANRDISRDMITVGPFQILQPDIRVSRYRAYNNRWHNLFTAMYLKSQRIMGCQINMYWVRNLLGPLSIGIGGGFGGAFVVTKFTTWEALQVNRGDLDNILGYFWEGTDRYSRKYVYNGTLLYNFTTFLCYEGLRCNIECGYRYISFSQLFDNTVYTKSIPKLADLTSDQIYLGLGIRF